MYRHDEVAIQVPQDDGSDVWQNGRTGEVTDFVVFKVAHHKDASGTVRYKIAEVGVGMLKNPFTGEKEQVTVVLSRPDSLFRPKPPASPYPPVISHPKPMVRFKWPVLVAVFLSLAFWALVIYWLWGVLCR